MDCKKQCLKHWCFRLFHFPFTYTHHGLITCTVEPTDAVSWPSHWLITTPSETKVSLVQITFIFRKETDQHFQKPHVFIRKTDQHLQTSHVFIRKTDHHLENPYVFIRKTDHHLQNPIFYKEELTLSFWGGCRILLLIHFVMIRQEEHLWGHHKVGFRSSFI